MLIGMVWGREPAGGGRLRCGPGAAPGCPESRGPRGQAGEDPDELVRGPTASRARSRRLRACLGRSSPCGSEQRRQVPSTPWTRHGRPPPAAAVRGLQRERLAAPTSLTGPHGTCLPGQAPCPQASRLNARRANTDLVASLPSDPTRQQQRGTWPPRGSLARPTLPTVPAGTGLDHAEQERPISQAKGPSAKTPHVAQKPPSHCSATAVRSRPGEVPKRCGPAPAPHATLTSHNRLHRVPTPRRPSGRRAHFREISVHSARAALNWRGAPTARLGLPAVSPAAGVLSRPRP